jgi:DNA-binding NarL/FixJ family response regulator
VDDNPAMLARAAAVLQPACEVVGTAGDGPTALAVACALRPDVVVLDISMPGMTGLEVAGKLRGAGNGAAVVFLTVHDEEEIVTAARAAGATGYVVKPRLCCDLLKAVTQAHAGHPFVSPVITTDVNTMESADRQRRIP